MSRVDAFGRWSTMLFPPMSGEIRASPRSGRWQRPRYELVRRKSRAVSGVSVFRSPGSKNTYAECQSHHHVAP